MLLEDCILGSVLSNQKVTKETLNDHKTFFSTLTFFANEYIVKKKHVAIVRNFIVTNVLCIPTKTQFLVWFVTVTVLSIATYQVHVKYQYILCSK